MVSKSTSDSSSEAVDGREPSMEPWIELPMSDLHRVWVPEEGLA